MANFLVEGITTTHSARSRSGLGRASGMPRISFSTSPESCRRSCSLGSFFSSASAGIVTDRANSKARKLRFMSSILARVPRKRRLLVHNAQLDTLVQGADSGGHQDH